MSLGIVFKGPEGIVLAADSRVTLNAEQQGPNGEKFILPATFDNATKLLRIKGQEHVGAVTYGVGAIGGNTPRTAHSFLSEFEEALNMRYSGGKASVEDFAKELSSFFADQWKTHMAGAKLPANNDMIFFVAGYDAGASYGRVFEFAIPSRPEIKEWFPNDGFGAIWGGQHEFVERLINGFDPKIITLLGKELNLPVPSVQKAMDAIKPHLGVAIPYPFLPLQDCVDLSIFLVRLTIQLQTWTVGLRGVGGAIDVATITKTSGFRAIQEKQIAGEKSLY